ncbi:1976_t:CDS:2, partial [Racocetra fulgida]
KEIIIPVECQHLSHEPLKKVHSSKIVEVIEEDISPSIEEPLEGQILRHFENLLGQLNLVYQQAQVNIKH